MDDSVPQSIFVVVSWELSAPHSISILQLNTKRQRPFETQKQRPLEAPLNQKEYVAHFNQPHWSDMDWMFCSSTSTHELYMLPYRILERNERDVPLKGCVFDFRTNRCRPMPSSGIRIKHVLTLGGAIYGIASPNRCDNNIPFMRYDPARSFWQPLKPFPRDAYHKLGSKAYTIVATAVLNDTILFNMGCRELWAYDVKRDIWCPVKVEDPVWSYRIEGVAAVLEDTIYALTTHPVIDGTLVLALSIRREDDLGFVCSGPCKILVDTNSMGVRQTTSHLVHLGKDNFCLVQSCQLDESRFDGYQRIKLTNIKLSGENSNKSMTVIDECVHLLRVPYCEQFHVEFCFSLPECKTTAIKEGKNLCLNLNPFPKGYDPKEKFKTDLHRDREPEDLEYGPLVNVGTSKLLAKSNATSKASTTLGNAAASEAMYIDAEGHSISVRHLSPDATLGQFKKELMKFGPSKTFEIQFTINDTVSAIITEGCRAEPEMEKNTHKTEGCRAEVEETEGRAEIEENTLITEGCRAEMEENTHITEGCRAEMEETEGCRAEMEETEGCRAKMEENRRISLTIDDNRTSKNARKKLKKKQRKLKKKLGDVGGGNLPLQPKPVLVILVVILVVTFLRLMLR